MYLVLFSVLFVGLKLVGGIDWGWFFVLIPFYITFFRFVFSVCLIESIKETKRTGRAGWASKLLAWLKDFSK